MLMKKGQLTMVDWDTFQFYSNTSHSVRGFCWVRTEYFVCLLNLKMMIQSLDNRPKLDESNVQKCNCHHLYSPIVIKEWPSKKQRSA